MSEKVIYVCGTCGRHKEGLKEWLVMDCNRCHRQMLPVKKERDEWKKNLK